MGHYLMTVEYLNEFAIAIGLEHSPIKSKSECLFLEMDGEGGAGGQRGAGCTCTYDIIDLQNTTYSLGGQLNSTG